MRNMQSKIVDLMNSQKIFDMFWFWEILSVDKFIHPLQIKYYSEYYTNWELKMSTIRFKFKSAKDFEVVTFNGMGLRLFDLKRRVVEKRQMNKGLDFELQVTNAQTEEGDSTQWRLTVSFMRWHDLIWQLFAQNFISIQRWQCNGVKEYRCYCQKNAGQTWMWNFIKNEEPRLWECNHAFNPSVQCTFLTHLITLMG